MILEVRNSVTQLRVLMEISSPGDRLCLYFVRRSIDGRTAAIGVLSKYSKAAKQGYPQGKEGFFHVQCFGKYNIRYSA